MSRIAYVNGRYVPHGTAAVHIEDRGYQLADGVYEVWEVRGGRLIDEARHLARLGRSLTETRIDWPIAPKAIGVVMREVVRRNRVREGIVYVQVTRGVAPRDHAFPTTKVTPSLVVTARSMPMAAREARARKGVAVVTAPDNRWGRVDIKSVGLLPNVLAKQRAREEGAHEAWFIDTDGKVTEGASTNAWIIAKDEVITRQADYGILAGITRAALLDVLARQNLRLVERPFSLAEATAADEAFLTSATSAVTPVVRVDGRLIGSGKPGPTTRKLRALLLAEGGTT